MRNQIGKIVINASLYKGMTVKPQETKGKTSGAILSLQSEGSMAQFLLKVNPSVAGALIKALEDNTPK